MSLRGFATPEGTLQYKNKFQTALDPGHFRSREGLWFSSIGIGSYLGEADHGTDALYEEALREAVCSGINVIDSAINYRHQRSERSFGRAIQSLAAEGKVRREELIVCTKGGFIPFDGEYPADPRRYVERVYRASGLLEPGDLAQACHAISPKYLEDQLAKSLSNLGLETIDIYYLHNPETQLMDFERTQFLDRMRAAFRWLEEKVAQGKIRMYGTATWNGYRVPADREDYLSLQDLLVLAREAAGGTGHHFKAVQLPFNLAMPEAWIFPNQSFGANTLPFLAAAERLGITVIASAALLQARLSGKLPEFLDAHFEDLEKSSQRAIQFARSVPGITTALVGMKNRAHLAENMETAKRPALTEERLVLMFQGS